MKLSRLFELHQKHRAQGLSGNFGDGYLMANNKMYRAVRTAALAAGFVFSNERNEAYESFPLLQLDSLLEAKTFPYTNNVIAFDSMTPVQLEALTWEDIDGNLKKNFVFHEACHGVVHSLILKTMGPVPGFENTTDLDGQRRKVLRMLLEESCSNTCELLGVIDAGDQAHRIFYEMNSYVCEFENRTNLKNAMAHIGPAVVIKFMILAYLHSNFLVEGLDEKAFQDIVKIVSPEVLNPKDLKTLRAIGKIAFQLSERFRVQTTSFHLRLAGVKTPTDELFDFHFLFSLEKQKGFNSFLSQFVSLIETSA